MHVHVIVFLFPTELYILQQGDNRSGKTKDRPLQERNTFGVFPLNPVWERGPGTKLETRGHEGDMTNKCDFGFR